MDIPVEGTELDQPYSRAKTAQTASSSDEEAAELEACALEALLRNQEVRWVAKPLNSGQGGRTGQKRRLELCRVEKTRLKFLPFSEECDYVQQVTVEPEGNCMTASFCLLLVDVQRLLLQGIDVQDQLQ